MPIPNNRDDDLRDSWLSNLLDKLDAAENCPSREEIAEMIDQRISEHENVGQQWGVVYLAVHCAIVLWFAVALYWIGQRV